jgi:hypothetical protein
MVGLLEPVAEFLDDQGWAYEPLGDRDDVLSFPFRGDREAWTCFAEAFEEQERVVFYSVVPFNVPEEGRPGVMEFITRVNYGLLIGNFELDLADGELRFKTGLDVRGAELTATLAGRAIIPNLHAMNTYLPGLEALIGDDPAVPAEIVAEIEGG